MDLRRHVGVLSRFRDILIVGLVVAICLTFIAAVRVSTKHGFSTAAFSWRQQETWQATETMHLTQCGLVLPTANSPDTTAPSCDVPESNVLVYQQLANSDPVRRVILSHGPIDGKFDFFPVTDPLTHQSILPFLSVDGFSSSPAKALLLTKTASQSFREYLLANQPTVPARQRVVATVTTQAKKVTLAQGRKRTLPIVIFLAIMIAAVALAYILENLYPRAESRSERAAQDPSVSELSMVTPPGLENGEPELLEPEEDAEPSQLAGSRSGRRSESKT